MSSPFTIEFSEWIGRLGYRIQVSGDAWMLTNFSEMTYYVRAEEGRYVLHEQSRNDPPEFVMSASSVVDIERHLTTYFGFSVRSMLRLPYIFVGGRPGFSTVANAAPEFRLELLERSRVGLVDANGHVRCVFYGDLADRSCNAVEFSWFADASLEDLRRSYLDPDGLPLFPGCSIGPVKPSA